MWAKDKTTIQPDYFSTLKESQEPPFLFIGCSDSRVPPTALTKSGPNTFFVHHNVANQISSSDMNFMVALEFAVNTLHVRHIIVCGHYRCGGVQAAIKGADGLMGAWVQPVRRTYLMNREELDKLDELEQWRKLVELNVINQVKNLLHLKVLIEPIFAGKSTPTIHAAITDLRDGLIKELPLPLDEWKATGLIPQSYNNNNHIVG